MQLSYARDGIVKDIALLGDFELQNLTVRFLHLIFRILKRANCGHKFENQHLSEIFSNQQYHSESIFRNLINEINSSEISSVNSFLIKGVRVCDSKADNWEGKDIWIDCNKESITIWLQKEELLMEIIFVNISKWEIQSQNIVSIVTSGQDRTLEIVFQKRSDLIIFSGILGKFIPNPRRFSIATQHIDCNISGPVPDTTSTASRHEKEAVIFTSSSLIEQSYPLEAFRDENDECMENTGIPILCAC